MPQRVIQLTLLKELLILTEAKADVTATDEKCRNPLHYAAMGECKTAVKVLLEAGKDPRLNARADVNVKNDDSWTPLDWAVDSATAQALIHTRANRMWKSSITPPNCN